MAHILTSNFGLHRPSTLDDNIVPVIETDPVTPNEPEICTDCDNGFT
jgi:hypothetical protein